LLTVTGLLVGGLSPIFFPTSPKNTFWIALCIGVFFALLVNFLCPKYEKAGKFWKPIYEFLLKQFPPID
jgi:hypothetical protein